MVCVPVDAGIWSVCLLLRAFGSAMMCLVRSAVCGSTWRAIFVFDSLRYSRRGSIAATVVFGLCPLLRCQCQVALVVLDKGLGY